MHGDLNRHQGKIERRHDLHRRRRNRARRPSPVKLQTVQEQMSSTRKCGARACSQKPVLPRQPFGQSFGLQGDVGDGGAFPPLAT